MNARERKAARERYWGHVRSCAQCKRVADEPLELRTEFEKTRPMCRDGAELGAIAYSDYKDVVARDLLYVVLLKDWSDTDFFDARRIYGPVLGASVHCSAGHTRITFSTGQSRSCRARCLGPYIAVLNGLGRWVVQPGFPGAGEEFVQVSFLPGPPLDHEVHDLVPVVEALDMDWESRQEAGS